MMAELTEPGLAEDPSHGGEGRYGALGAPRRGRRAGRAVACSGSAQNLAGQTIPDGRRLS